MQKLKKDPYVTTLGGFSKVTNYIYDAFRGTEEQHQRPPEEVADLLGEVIPGLEINQLEEPGFEVITRVRNGFCTIYRILNYSRPLDFWKCFSVCRAQVYEALTVGWWWCYRSTWA